MLYVGAAMLVVCALMLLSRWAFGDSGTPEGPRRSAVSPGDYGLLVAVATVATRDDAVRLGQVLAAHGIRSTLGAAGPSDRVPVLVFAADATAARDVLVTGG